ncbi:MULTISPECIES: hypothetical protein [Enterobacterales]|uniref:hypothetical protein n=1 Tax=Enterobacterales TaxID=91347 RepID=UPI002ED918C4
MIHKAVNQLPDIPENLCCSGDALIASEFVDVRDLLVRMHSDEPAVRDSARKILVNFICTAERQKHTLIKDEFF